jgi:hypothetical protein
LREIAILKKLVCTPLQTSLFFVKNWMMQKEDDGAIAVSIICLIIPGIGSLCSFKKTGQQVMRARFLCVFLSQCRAPRLHGNGRCGLV